MTTTATQPRKSKTRLLELDRHFSSPTTKPFDQITWERRSTSIGDGKTIIFQQDNVEIPTSWSLLATKIVVSKYFYGDISNGTNPSNHGRESSVRQLIDRVATAITKWGVADGYFNSIQADIFHDELTWLLVNQYGAFNSPVWFNVGLYESYGIGKDGQKGNWVYNPHNRKAEVWNNQYEYPQASACFIQGVDDTMESIMELARSEAMLFKYGSGTGSDLSTLRSTREKLSGGGKPSGPMSFLRIWDQVAGTIKSGGKTRRAAKMNTLKTWHPDIEEFIDAKSTEEKKAWALIEAGYDGSYNGNAYGSVMYQNENLSVRATDEFMNKSMAPEGDVDGNYFTTRVTDGKDCEVKNARVLLRKIAEGTHLCGDPGMQFEDTIHTWHTCKGTGRQNSTNPCSEYLFLDNTACNLASLNLLKFKMPDGSFDAYSFEKACRIFITAQEILVDRASYPTQQIAENSHIFRTLGLGFANLGALIMSYGLGYDSDEGRAMAGAITALMTGTAYAQSAYIASVKDAFPGYRDARCSGVDNPEKPDNVDSMADVIALHRDACVELCNKMEDAPAHYSGIRDIAFRALDQWDVAVMAGDKHGYRNAQVTVLAPTGTIGFLMDCDTTGIEPDIALVKYKELAGGGHLKIVNQTVESALLTLAYSKVEIERILKHIDTYDTIEDVGTGSGIVKSGLRPDHLSVFDCAFKAQQGTRSLHYMGHLRMMAACQPFLSGAISKTVNLPETASVDDIVATYTEGWKLGLKAIAIYRDGSKRSAPLSTKAGGFEKAATVADPEVAEQIKELEDYIALLEQAHGEPVRKKLPDTRNAKNHKFEVSGHKGYLNVGLFDTGQPGEIFISMSKEGSTIGGLMDTVATLTSISLQYGVPLASLVKKFAFQRFEPSGFTKNQDIRNATSIIDYVFRWLACEFIPGYREELRPVAHQPVTMGPLVLAPEPVVTPIEDIDGPALKMSHFLPDPCANCGSSKVVRSGVCGVCTECGTSAGCS